MQTNCSIPTTVSLLLVTLLITACSTPPPPRTPLSANEARVTGQHAHGPGGNGALEVYVARDDSSQNPVFHNSITIPAAKNKILVNIKNVWEGRYIGSGFVISTMPTPRNLRHFDLDAKTGHEYRVDAKYRAFAPYWNSPITVIDTTTGQVIYTTPNPAY
jgi:hypothetical protein